MNDASIKAPKLPADIVFLSFEANVVQPMTWLDRLAQTERTAYLRNMICETLRNG